MKQLVAALKKNPHLVTTVIVALFAIARAAGIVVSPAITEGAMALVTLLGGTWALNTLPAGVPTGAAVQGVTKP